MWSSLGLYLGDIFFWPPSTVYISLYNATVQWTSYILYALYSFVLLLYIFFLEGSKLEIECSLGNLATNETPLSLFLSLSLSRYLKSFKLIKGGGEKDFQY